MPKTLLVVDESRTIREAARLALAGNDWEIIEASDRPEAVRELRMHFPDAVLCDAGLGSADDFSLCREIRGTPQGREAPILLMGSRIDRAAAAAVGVHQTIVKPFGSEELAEALQSAVELQSLSLELGSADDEHSVVPLSADEGAGETGLEVVEIIDLSGDEDFDGLDLLDDLEPVEIIEPVAPEPLRLDPTDWEAGLSEALAPIAPPEPPLPDIDEFDLSALEPETETLPAREPSVAETSPWVEEAVELPADLGFGLTSPPPAAGAAPAVIELAAPLEETPYSYEPAAPPWNARPSGHEEPAAWPCEAPLSPQDAGTLGATVAATAETAVREALGQSLSAEALTPLVAKIVERVVWEVVPQLAERLILEAIEKLKTPPER